MVKLHPPHLFTICLVLSFIVHLSFQSQLSGRVRIFGALFIVYGIILNLWADMLYKKSKTTVKPHDRPIALIRHGPFKYTRNPMYLGMALILLGFAVALGSYASMIFPFAFIAMMEGFFIPVEEKILDKTFGSAYKRYKSRVRKWL